MRTKKRPLQNIVILDKEFARIFKFHKQFHRTYYKSTLYQLAPMITYVCIYIVTLSTMGEVHPSQ